MSSQVYEGDTRAVKFAEPEVSSCSHCKLTFSLEIFLSRVLVMHEIRFGIDYKFHGEGNILLSVVALTYIWNGMMMMNDDDN